MDNPREDLLQLAHDLRTSLSVLRGFGVRTLVPPLDKSSGDQQQPGPSDAAETEADSYHFGDGRRAKWEQAMRDRIDRDPQAEKTGPSRRQQAHLFAKPQPEETSPDQQVVSSWQPNPLSPEEAQQKLLALQAEIGDCRRCKLCEERNSVVFGEGHPTARLVLAGEGPGREEDRTGRPFVGRAGQLLDRIISAMGFKREETYICNVVKCRPPDNRTPQDDEMRTCGIFLSRQLEIIRPRHVIALGATAAKYLTSTNLSMGRLRGRFFDYHNNARLLATYHPAYLLRNPAAKKDVWADVQLVMAEIAESAEET